MTRDYDKAEIIEENEPEDAHLEIAFQKLVVELGGVSLSEDAGLIECAFRTLDSIEELQDRIENLEKENDILRERLDGLGDIGVKKTSKQAKIASIVMYANNVRDDDKPAVKVLPKDIRGAADVSRRYAYDLIDTMINGDGENGTIGPDGYSWAHDPDEIAQYGSIERKKTDKAVLIDFEGEHGEPVSENKFNTESTDEEATG